MEVTVHLRLPSASQKRFLFDRVRGRAYGESYCILNWPIRIHRSVKTVLSDVKLKGPENHLKDFVATFLSTNFGAKLGCKRAVFLTSAGVLWLLFVLFLTILRRIQSTIFESSVRRRQNCLDNLFICVNFAKKRFCWCPFDREDRQQRRSRKEMHRFW